jgi:transcriptional regulator with XRE-family HTH domain
MARTLNDFIAALPQEEQRAIHQEAERLIAEEMTLRELRKARARSQQVVGRALKVNQATVSKLERRTDMYVSTLRSFIEAMGGELDIIARFPDHIPVRISQFEELGDVFNAPAGLDLQPSHASTHHPSPSRRSSRSVAVTR